MRRSEAIDAIALVVICGGFGLWYLLTQDGPLGLWRAVPLTFAGVYWLFRGAIMRWLVPDDR